LRMITSLSSPSGTLMPPRLPASRSRAILASERRGRPPPGQEPLSAPAGEGFVSAPLPAPILPRRAPAGVNRQTLVRRSAHPRHGPGHERPNASETAGCYCHARAEQGWRQAEAKLTALLPDRRSPRRRWRPY
jgi:hypothetical protein